MSIISVGLPGDGTVADVADINTPITTIVNAINGNLDNSNIATGAAIDGTKLATGSVPAAQLNFGGSGAGIWWQEIGRTTLGTAGDSISVTLSSSKKYLHLVAWYSATGGALDTILRFNSDSGNNYSSNISLYDGNGMTASANASAIPTDINPNTNDQAFLTGEVVNITAKVKLVMLDSVFAAPGAGNAQAPVKSFGQWANTSTQITSVQLINAGAGDFTIGSELIVLGHD